MPVEGIESKVGVVGQTPAEAVKPTEPKEESTVPKTYTEEDFRREVDKGVSKGIRTLEQQVSAERKATATAKAEAEAARVEGEARLAHIEALKREVEEALDEDPDRKKAYINRLANLEREQKVANREAAAARMEKAAATKAQELEMAMAARELMEETGIPLKELEGCETKAEMKIKALEYKLANQPEIEKAPQKFDSATSTGSGGGIPTDMVQFRKWIAKIPQGEYEKVSSEVNKMMREGKIK